MLYDQHLLRSCLEVYDFEIGQSLMWVTGLGQKQFEGNYINNDKDYFIDCFDLAGICFGN